MGPISQMLVESLLIRIGGWHLADGGGLSWPKQTTVGTLLRALSSCETKPRPPFGGLFISQLGIVPFGLNRRVIFGMDGDVKPWPNSREAGAPILSLLAVNN